MLQMSYVSNYLNNYCGMSSMINIKLNDSIKALT